MVVLGSPQAQAARNGFRGTGIGHSLGIGGAFVVAFTAPQDDRTVPQPFERLPLQSFETGQRREGRAALTTVPARQIVNAAQSDRRAEGIGVAAQPADCRESPERGPAQNGLDAIVVTIFADPLQDLLIYKGVVAILQTRAVPPRAGGGEPGAYRQSIDGIGLDASPVNEPRERGDQLESLDLLEVAPGRREDHHRSAEVPPARHARRFGQTLRCPGPGLFAHWAGSVAEGGGRRARGAEPEARGWGAPMPPALPQDSGRSQHGASLSCPPWPLLMTSS